MNDTLNILDNDSVLVGHNYSTLLINVNNSRNDIFSFVSNDTLFTVVTTLSIFILGIVITRLITLYERKRKKQRTKKYFKLLFNKIYDKLLPQLTEGYERYYQVIDVDNGMPQTTPQQPDGDYKRLANADVEELLSTFNYDTNISTVLGGIDYIIKIVEESDKYHKNVLAKSDKMRDVISNLFESYLNSLYNYLDYEKEHSPNYESDEIWIFINEKYLKYHEDFDGKRSLTKVINEIVRPIRMKLAESQYHKGNQLAKDIFIISKTIYLRYCELERFTIEVRGEFEDFYKKIKKINDFVDVKL